MEVRLERSEIYFNVYIAHTHGIHIVRTGEMFLKLCYLVGFACVWLTVKEQSIRNYWILCF